MRLTKPEPHVATQRKVHDPEAPAQLQRVEFSGAKALPERMGCSTWMICPPRITWLEPCRKRAFISYQLARNRYTHVPELRK